MSDYRTPGNRSLGQLEILVNKTKSVLTATTNWGNLTFDDNGKIVGTVSASGTNITSDALKSAIENYTNFATFIDGKLNYSTASIKQKADKNGSKISLVASFGTDANGSITLEAVRTGFLNKIESTITISADNIKAEAKEAIIAQAKEVTIDAMLNTKGTAVFNRGVSFQSVTFFNGVATFNKKLKIVDSWELAQDVTSIFKGDVTIQAGKVLYLGKDTLEKYIQNVVNAMGFIKTLNSADVRAALRGSDTMGDYIKKVIGCTSGNNPISLSEYIKGHAARPHTHTVSVSHTHTISDGAKTTNAAPSSSFTTSSNS